VTALRQHIGSVTLLVDDYDTAIAYFTETLGFALTTDEPKGAGDRWIVVTPSGGGAAIRLSVARDQRQRDAIGSQAGGRVLFVLMTDDVGRDHAAYRARGVTFIEEPRDEPYGVVAVFADRWGNRWDLIQSRATPD
jgi:catechol 2,3-dioxygenase-like lactoylglutathione lyase family enzyme